MPTTDSTTFPSFKAALTAAVDAVADCQVAYRWPGPETEGEGIFLADVTGSKSIPTIVAGRKARDEEYRFDAICQSFTASPDLSDLAAADVRAAELEAFVDGVLADNPTLDVAGVITAGVVGFRTESVAFGRGIAIRLTATVQVTARLN